MANNDNSGIGVLTHIDGTDIDEISKSHRREWAENLCTKIEELDGVDEAFVSDADRYFKSVILVVSVSVERTDANEMKLSANLRSLGQRMMNTVRDDDYATANIFEPQIVDSPDPAKRDSYYKTNQYRIEVNYP